MDDDLEFGMLGRLFTGVTSLLGWYRIFPTDDECHMQRMLTPSWDKWQSWCDDKKRGELPQSIADAISDIPIVDRRITLWYLCGRGSWGKVYFATTKKKDAIKEMAVKIIEPSERAKKAMEYRGLTLEQALQKEVLPKNLGFISERVLRKDALGRYCIVMPYYRHFLSDYVSSFHHGSQLALASGIVTLPLLDVLHFVERKLGTLSARRSARYEHMELRVLEHLITEMRERYKAIRNPMRILPLTDVAQGLANLHAIGRVHADCKPDNIAIRFDGNHIVGLLNDLGTSTEDRWAPNRDNIGSALTRPPELYYKGSHPTTRSDVWSLGALTYLVVNDSVLLTEGERAKLLRGTADLHRLDGIIQERIRTNTEDPLMVKFLSRCLAIDPGSRYANAAAVELDLAKAVLEATNREFALFKSSPTHRLDEIKEAADRLESAGARLWDRLVEYRVDTYAQGPGTPKVR